MPQTKLNIVLLEPEIPQNTGNIARTCVGFNANLHLIRPYGFIFNKKMSELKRSGVNYWDKLKIFEHDSYNEFIKSIKKQSYDIYFITRYGKNTPEKIKSNKKNIYILFGKESIGIDKLILKANKNKTIRIPITSNVRSLNVSNCVAIIAYEFIKKTKYSGLKIQEPHKPLF
ncbi:MAG: tRNA (cytidine(34)-2'-O)-methyltransferase [Mycoplasmataceae bacterium]|nr:tRNA (cytidine(34)-2'-O)-methyltransferase [Mycoplasmataceae bacterium]